MFPRKYFFCGIPGLKVGLGEEPMPLQIFKEFITDDILAYIVQETNRYAELVLITLSNSITILRSGDHYTYIN